MKIALVNPPYLYAYGKIKGGDNCSYPLGLGYIASYIRQYGHEAAIFDPDAQKISLDVMYQRIKDFGAQLVGITAVTANFTMAKQIASDIKSQMGIYVVMGGPHATALPKSTLLSISSLDAVIKGEGEIPMKTIADSFDQTGSIDLNNIPSVSFFKDGQQYVSNQRIQMIKDLDSLPYPARDLVDIFAYKLPAHFQRGKCSATILSSRGCPSKCTYCANLTMKRIFRPHSPAYFIGEIEDLIEKYKIKHFHIADDCFTCDAARLEEICDLIIAHKLHITWFCFGRIDNLQDELVIKKMYDAGCVYVLLGIESGSQRILNIMKKDTSLPMIENCCRLLKKHKIKFFNSFIIGNEEDTKETVMETIALAKKLESVMVGFNIMTPFPGTHIFNKFFKDYDNPNTDWNNWCTVGNDIAYEPRQTPLSKQELHYLTSLAYRSYYLDFKAIARILSFINNPRTMLEYIKGGMGLARQVISWKFKSRNSGDKQV